MCNTINANNDELQHEKPLETTVFELSNNEQKLYFIAWILGISDNEVERGFDFIKDNNASFQILFELFSCLDICTVVVENHYVDRVYRDSYYFYYSSKHFSYSRYCKRISLFCGQLQKNFFDYDSLELESSFVGSIVIRPLPNRSIGRTLLSPSYFLKANTCQIRVAKYTITVYGKRLSISAFPYSMQDGETTSCAEITILNLLDYYSQSYPEYHYLLPSDICMLAEKNSYERRIPTTGLSYELISKIFCDAGFYPRLYATQKMSKIKFKHIINYYIESGIPVALGLKLGEENKHSVICVGHISENKFILGDKITCAYDSKSNNAVWVCDTADYTDTYCIMDDNKMPYTCEECTENTLESNRNITKLELDGCEIEYMMVPLYKRMILEASDAYSICMSILSDCYVGFVNAIKRLDLRTLTEETTINYENLGEMENPLVIRMFMASSRSFRKRRDDQFSKNNHEMRDLYNMTVFPKFIWVCEISTKELYKNNYVIGEIVIDATSAADAKIDSSILINYPYLIGRRMPFDINNTNGLIIEKLEKWNPFEVYIDNLTNFSPNTIANND